MLCVLLGVEVCGCLGGVVFEGLSLLFWIVFVCSMSGSEALMCCLMCNARAVSRVTRHTSRITRHRSHVTRHTSHVTRHTSLVTRHTSTVTRHTSLVLFEAFVLGFGFWICFVYIDEYLMLSVFYCGGGWCLSFVVWV